MKANINRRKWQTDRQRRALAKYFVREIDQLSKQEIKVLSTHPYLTPRQRAMISERLVAA